MEQMRNGDAKGLPGPLRTFWIINVGLGLLCALVMRIINRSLLHKEWPYTSPFLPFWHFWDFTGYMTRFTAFHSPEFFSNRPSFGFPFEYPASIALLYRAFYSFGVYSVQVYLLTSAVAVLAFVLLLAHGMQIRGIRMQEQILFLGSVLLFSYPFWTEALLGNVEVWVFVVVAAAILLYLRGHSYLAGILFGIAAAMKIFPVIYLGLFLPRRQYKQIALALVAAVTINVIGLWAVCPDIRLSAHGIAAGIAENRAHYMLHYLPAETGIDHSIFGFLKVCYMGVKHRVIISSWLLTAYMAFIALGGVALYFLKIWKLPLMNQVVVLCILSVLLPPTSHDYTLMHLYIPWGLLILYLLQYREWNAHALWFTAVFVCFALLFSPQAELIYRAKQFSGEIKCVVLILLLFLVLRKPLSKPLLEQKQDVPA